MSEIRAREFDSARNSPVAFWPDGKFPNYTDKPGQTENGGDPAAGRFSVSLFHVFRVFQVF
jgi:hypothetical protein